MPEATDNQLTTEPSHVKITNPILKERTWTQASADVFLHIYNWTFGFLTGSIKTYNEEIWQKNCEMVLQSIKDNPTCEQVITQFVTNYSKLLHQKDSLTEEQREILEKTFNEAEDTVDKYLQSNPIETIYTLLRVLKVSRVNEESAWYERTICAELIEKYPDLFLNTLFLLAAYFEKLPKAGKQFFYDLHSFILQESNSAKLIPARHYLLECMHKKQHEYVEPTALVIGGETKAIADEPETSTSTEVTEFRKPSELSASASAPSSFDLHNEPEEAELSTHRYNNISVMELNLASLIALHHSPFESVQEHIMEQVKSTQNPELIAKFVLITLSFGLKDGAFLTVIFTAYANKCMQEEVDQKKLFKSLCKQIWHNFARSVRKYFRRQGIGIADEDTLRNHTLYAILNHLPGYDDPVLQDRSVTMLQQQLQLVKFDALVDFVGSLVYGGQSIMDAAKLWQTTNLIKTNSRKRQQNIGTEIAKYIKDPKKLLSLPYDTYQQAKGAIQIPIEIYRLSRSTYDLYQTFREVDKEKLQQSITLYNELSAQLIPGYSIAALEAVKTVVGNELFRYTVYSQVDNLLEKLKIDNIVASAAGQFLVPSLIQAMFFAAVSPALILAAGPVAGAAAAGICFGAFSQTETFNAMKGDYTSFLKIAMSGLTTDFLGLNTSVQAWTGSSEPYVAKLMDWVDGQMDEQIADTKKREALTDTYYYWEKRHEDEVLQLTGGAEPNASSTAIVSAQSQVLAFALPNIPASMQPAAILSRLYIGSMHLDILTIQSLRRRLLARRIATEEKRIQLQLAITAQRILRGRLGRLYAKQFAAQLMLLATTAQRLSRGHLVRRSVAQLKLAATTQILVRCALAHHQLAQAAQLRLACTIQRMRRGQLDRRLATAMKAAKERIKKQEVQMSQAIDTMTSSILRDKSKLGDENHIKILLSTSPQVALAVLTHPSDDEGTYLFQKMVTANSDIIKTLLSYNHASNPHLGLQLISKLWFDEKSGLKGACIADPEIMKLMLQARNDLSLKLRHDVTLTALPTIQDRLKDMLNDYSARLIPPAAKKKAVETLLAQLKTLLAQLKTITSATQADRLVDGALKKLNEALQSIAKKSWLNQARLGDVVSSLSQAVGTGKNMVLSAVSFVATNQQADNSASSAAAATATSSQ